MESWQKVWREGFAPNLSTQGLQGLKIALELDEQRLLQGATTQPPPLMCVQDWPCEGADPIGFCGFCEHIAIHNVTPSVGQVEEYFAQKCFECDQLLGEPAACRWFLNWWDDTPRDEVRLKLLEEVNLILTQRAETVTTHYTENGGEG
jgi:hypothetical protein